MLRKFSEFWYTVIALPRSSNLLHIVLWNAIYFENNWFFKVLQHFWTYHTKWICFQFWKWSWVLLTSIESHIMLAFSFRTLLDKVCSVVIIEVMPREKFWDHWTFISSLAVYDLKIPIPSFVFQMIKKWVMMKMSFLVLFFWRFNSLFAILYHQCDRHAIRI